VKLLDGHIVLNTSFLEAMESGKVKTLLAVAPSFQIFSILADELLADWKHLHYHNGSSSGVPRAMIDLAPYK
jgi:hypothetical protein